MRRSLGVLAMTAMLATGSVARSEPQHAVYVDALGKGGLWGLGYDVRLRDRFVVGAVGSFYLLGGDRFTTLSPYVGAYPVRGARHSWFVHLGPQFVLRDTPSPVPEWDGMRSHAMTGEMSSGYEYRHHVLFRVYALAAIGARFAPGLGISLGWAR